MNAKNFMSILRKVIREEVRTAVRLEVKQLLQEQQKSQLPKQAKQVAQQKRPSPVVFDGPLSSILNETAQSMYSSPAEQEAWQDIGGGTFTADSAESFGLSALMNQETAVADSAPSHFSGDPTMAFIKDYSSVMKAADKFSNKV